ncbi:ubiquitin-like domain-containing protein [Effusibacillus consociatus]|uniref:Ubiquitin-like domain-containing protein n=1 Tax=Effusibacillus consociatus TaxID=1117041 RepID=A0ABV9Q059_9BACL
MRKLSGKSISILAAVAAVTAAGSGTAISLHKTVSVKVDGQSQEVSGFFTGSLQELLQKQGIQVSAQDLVQPGLKTPVTEGMSIVIKHARKVLLKDGNNEPKQLVTTADSVAEVLKQAGIELADQDRVNVELKSTPIEGQTIAITRREIQVAVTEEKIPFQTERQPNQDIFKGQEKVLTHGVEGLAKVTTRIILENGVEVDRKVEREVVKEPEKNVVAYGTKPVIVASRSGGSFTSAKKMVMSATAYAAGGRTATGRPAQFGVAAVDPSVIPLGTKLYIEGYGYAIAADTGGAIKGMKIDLVFNTQAECLQFGRRQVVVHIVE